MKRALTVASALGLGVLLLSYTTRPDQYTSSYCGEGSVDLRYSSLVAWVKKEPSMVNRTKRQQTYIRASRYCVDTKEGERCPVLTYEDNRPLGTLDFSDSFSIRFASHNFGGTDNGLTACLDTVEYGRDIETVNGRYGGILHVLSRDILKKPRHAFKRAYVQLDKR